MSLTMSSSYRGFEETPSTQDVDEIETDSSLSLMQDLAEKAESISCALVLAKSEFSEKMKAYSLAFKTITAEREEERQNFESELLQLRGLCAHLQSRQESIQAENQHVAQQLKSENDNVKELAEARQIEIGNLNAKQVEVRAQEQNTRAQLVKTRDQLTETCIQLANTRAQLIQVAAQFGEVRTELAEQEQINTQEIARREKLEAIAQERFQEKFQEQTREKNREVLALRTELSESKQERAQLTKNLQQSRAELCAAHTGRASVSEELRRSEAQGTLLAEALKAAEGSRQASFLEAEIATAQLQWTREELQKSTEAYKRLQASASEEAVLYQNKISALNELQEANRLMEGKLSSQLETQLLTLNEAQDNERTERQMLEASAQIIKITIARTCDKIRDTNLPEILSPERAREAQIAAGEQFLRDLKPKKITTVSKKENAS
jgi:hypothetical protein